MSRKSASSRVFQYTARRARASPMTVGAGLLIAIFVSLALWAAIIFGVVALLRG